MCYAGSKFFCRGLVCRAGFAFNRFFGFVTVAVILFVFVKAKVSSAKAIVFLEVGFITKTVVFLECGFVTEFAVTVLRTVTKFTFAVKFAFAVLRTVTEFAITVLGAITEFTFTVKFAFAVLRTVTEFAVTVLGTVAEFAFAILLTVVIKFAFAVLGTVAFKFAFFVFLCRFFFCFGCRFCFRFLFFFYCRFGFFFCCRFLFCFGFFFFLFGFRLTGHCEIRSKACNFVFSGVVFKNKVQFFFGKSTLSFFRREFFAQNIKNILYRLFKIFCNVRHFIFNIFNHLCYSSKSVHAVCSLFTSSFIFL